MTGKVSVNKTSLGEIDHEPLLTALGITISPQLLTLALTHRSYAYENGGIPTNERLEFLGDIVLGLAVTEKLYLEYPDRPEGDLAKIRASVVNGHALAAVARKLGPGGLGAHILLGRGEELTGGRDKSSILADAMESLLGAVHLEHGITVSRQIVLRHFAGLVERSALLGAGLDWKTSLQELAAVHGLGAPEYQVDSSGPDHNKQFVSTLYLGEQVYGTGEGKSKKESEQKSAALAYENLVAEYGLTSTNSADLPDKN